MIYSTTKRVRSWRLLAEPKGTDLARGASDDCVRYINQLRDALVMACDDLDVLLRIRVEAGIDQFRSNEGVEL